MPISKTFRLIVISASALLLLSSPVFAEYATVVQDETDDDTSVLDEPPKRQLSAEDTLDFDEDLCEAEAQTTPVRRQPNNIVSNCDQKNRVRCLTAFHVVKVKCRCNTFCEANDVEDFPLNPKVKCSWSNELGCHLALRPDQSVQLHQLCDRKMSDSCKEKRFLDIPFNHQTGRE